MYDRDYYENGIQTGKSNYRDYSWERLGQYFIGTAQYIIDQYHPTSVLDVGCAKGFMVYALQQLGVDAYGVDTSEYAVGNAITDRVKLGRIQEIPFDQKFDAVICFDVLEHIPEDESLQACRELLRVSNRLVLAHVLTRHVEEDKDPTHINVKPLEWWENTFRQAGGLILPSRPSGVWWFNTPEYLLTASPGRKEKE